MTNGAEATRVCASCGHSFAGAFCPRCGEEVLDARKLTVRHFLGQTVVHELFDLDGKIWRTLRFLLFRPGRLAIEYSAGRRRPYVKPVRVLITAIIVYVLVMPPGTGFTLEIGGLKLGIAPAGIAAQGSIEGTLFRIDRFGILERMFTERIGPVASTPSDVRDRFNRTLAAFTTTLSFTTVVLLALTLYACFHRRRPLLVEHAVFGMHYFSFVLLWTLLALLGTRLRIGFAASLVILGAVMIWQFAYLLVAIRRFYFTAASNRLLAWTASTGVAMLAYLLNSFYLTAVQLAGGALAILRL